jgi:23S rRNA (guanine2445-N2)-methyltransferase / 23S rRNA (guanine2069-N7)-methyltransferase
MKESLAAGLLLESGWDLLVNAAKGDGLPAVFVDPMAGSATLTIEAALIASDCAPGLMRINCYDKSKSETEHNPYKVPPVVRWKDADIKQWETLIAECEDRQRVGLDWMQQRNIVYPEKTNCIILGNELYSNAVDLALSNIESAGFSKIISMHQGDCKSWDLGGSHDDGTERAVIPGRTIIGTNPPWGLRLSEDIEESWYALNLFFRRECNSAEAWVLSGSKAATRTLRMKMTRRISIKTADEDLRWIQYHVFKKKVDTGDDQAHK